MEDFGETIRLNPSDQYAYVNRGLAYFDQGKFAESLPDFSRAAELAPGNLYRVLNIYLAKSRSGVNDQELLTRTEQSAEMKSWPGPVISMFLEKLAPEALLQAALAPGHPITEKNQLCEAHFYIGEYLLIKEHPAEAVSEFQQTVAMCQIGYTEYWSAKHELERMGR